MLSTGANLTFIKKSVLSKKLAKKGARIIN